jgi:hypothetical protein
MKGCGGEVWIDEGSRRPNNVKTPQGLSCSKKGLIPPTFKGAEYVYELFDSKITEKR